jgi:caffeoyl-CoA O-methyltransferase
MFVGTMTLSLATVESVERVVTLDVEPYLLDLTKPYWEQAGVADKIDARIGDARKSLEQLAKEGFKFDMVKIAPATLV